MNIKERGTLFWEIKKMGVFKKKNRSSAFHSHDHKIIDLPKTPYN